MEEAAARYLTEINNAAGWREAWGLVRLMVAELSPEHARDVMNAIYRRIDDVDKRKQILKPFVFGEGHPYALDVLHLAATDPEMAVRGRAFGYLRQYAYRDFSEDMDAYDAWRRQYGDRPLAETLRSNLRAFVERLRGADEEAYAKAMRQFLADGRIFKGAGVDMASVLQEAGLATLLTDRLSRPPPASEADRVAAARTDGATWSWLILSDPDGRVARPFVEEVLGSPDAYTPAAVSGAIRALGGIREPWAFDALLDTLKRGVPKHQHFYVGRAFAEQGDKRAVPWLIAAIAAAESYDTTYGFGNFGLGELTGVRYDKSHGAEWWQAWWDKHRDQFPPDVRKMDPRKLALR